MPHRPHGGANFHTWSCFEWPSQDSKFHKVKARPGVCMLAPGKPLPLSGWEVSQDPEGQAELCKAVEGEVTWATFKGTGQW